MALIEWANEMSVGIKSIDVEHKQLIDIINRFDAAVRARRAHLVVNAIFGDLIHYTQLHFAHEERLFNEYGYPGAELHIAEHRRLSRHVLRLQWRFADGKATASLETLAFLKDWLTDHILGDDLKYSAFFAEQIQTGRALGRRDSLTFTIPVGERSGADVF